MSVNPGRLPRSPSCGRAEPVAEFLGTHLTLFSDLSAFPSFPYVFGRRLTSVSPQILKYDHSDNFLAGGVTDRADETASDLSWL